MQSTLQERQAIMKCIFSTSQDNITGAYIFLVYRTWNDLGLTKSRYNNGTLFMLIDVIVRRASLLDPKLSWEPLLPISWSSILGTHDKHKHERSYFLNAKLSWDSTHQALMRHSISRKNTFVLHYQVNQTRRVYSIKLHAIRVLHVLFYLRLLGQSRIHLCERTFFHYHVHV